MLVLYKKMENSPYSGEGIPKYKIANPESNIDIVYWDYPNELVDRLRLLVSEQQAGNKIHTNEILSITEDLREAGYIVYIECVQSCLLHAASYRPIRYYVH